MWHLVLGNRVSSLFILIASLCGLPVLIRLNWILFRQSSHNFLNLSCFGWKLYEPWHVLLLLPVWTSPQTNFYPWHSYEFGSRLFFRHIRKQNYSNFFWIFFFGDQGWIQIDFGTYKRSRSFRFNNIGHDLYCSKYALFLRTVFW